MNLAKMISIQSKRVLTAATLFCALLAQTGFADLANITAVVDIPISPTMNNSANQINVITPPSPLFPSQGAVNEQGTGTSSQSAFPTLPSLLKPMDGLAPPPPQQEPENPLGPLAKLVGVWTSSGGSLRIPGNLYDNSYSGNNGNGSGGYSSSNSASSSAGNSAGSYDSGSYSDNGVISDDGYPSSQVSFSERIVFQVIPTQTNGSQVLNGLSYTETAYRSGEVIPFHQETGYWLWDKSAKQVIRVTALPRGIAFTAGGSAQPDAIFQLNPTTFTLTATAGSSAYGISSNLYLDANAKPLSYTLNVTIAKDGSSFNYTEVMPIQFKGTDRPFKHWVINTLIKSQ